jgi:glycosyltransferase involved in cell wall biosynthesis
VTVSAVIPTYNRVRQLAEAVESVLAQRPFGGELEIVVVDDGSTDATAAYLGDLAKRPHAPGVSVSAIHVPHCGLPGALRNAGIAAARGELLAFLDSDDLWVCDRLAAQMATISRDLPLVHAREVWLRDGSVVSQASQRHVRAGDLFAASLRKCVIGPSTVLLTRELFAATGGFRDDLEIAEDYELWLRMVDHVRVGYIDDPLVVKRAGHGDQLSERHGQIELFRINALRSLVDAQWFNALHDPLARDELSRKMRIYANGCRKRGREREAAEYQRMADRYAATEETT